MWVRRCVLSLLAAVVTTAVPVVVGAQSSSLDLSAEEQTIRELDEAWAAAAAARDAEAFASFYADDGVAMPPNMPPATGRAAVTELFSGLLAPNVNLSFWPTHIQVAPGGQMAYDIGSYEMSIDSPDGTVEDEGKYLVVWIKEDGEWKVAADMFSSNLPAK